MQLESFEQLEKAVVDADMVLVGLGEEWVLTENNILEDLEKKDPKMFELFSLATKNEQYKKIVPFLTAYYYDKYIPDMWKCAYENMLELLEGKNYFIVSLTIDSYLQKIGFKEDRCVNPCGSYRKVQCEDGCTVQLFPSEELLNKISVVIEEKIALDCNSQWASDCLNRVLILCNSWHCEKCGADIVFNLLDAKKYLEEGYLERWQIYMKWLQGTLNRKLCVIEAGTGMKLPSVIRWPFEKTVFYNQKANMFRVHKKYYQVNEEVAERAYACKCDSVQMFGEKKLEA